MPSGIRIAKLAVATASIAFSQFVSSMDSWVSALDTIIHPNREMPPWTTLHPPRVTKTAPTY